jgi:Mg2+/Co2+ transporter CorC
VRTQVLEVNDVEPLRSQIESFVDAASNRTQPIVSGEDGRRALSLALRSGFSRIPVIGDNEDDIIGVAYLKDLARRTHDADGHSNDHVEDVMRTPFFIRAKASRDKRP